MRGRRTRANFPGDEMIAADSVRWLSLLGAIFTVNGIVILGVGICLHDRKYRDATLGHCVPSLAIGLLLGLVAFLIR